MSIAISNPNIRDLDHAEQSAVNDLLELWRSKRQRNLLRAGFYDMKNSTRALMASSAPEVVKRRAFVLGWSSIAVDKLNRRCNLENFYEPNGNDLDSLGLSAIAESNRLIDQFSQAGISSLVHTPSWIITSQGDVRSGEAPVLYTFRDALTGSGRWDARRQGMKYYLSLNDFDDMGEPKSMTLFMPNANVEIIKSGGAWKATARRRHSYGVPVDPLRYRPRLGRPLGSSRINRSVMSLHQQAVGAMIRADVNGEAYSLSRYVLLGATESAFQNPDGSAKPAWMAAWDAVWAIGDDFDAPDGLERADVKQFTGQSPEPQNAHLRMLAQLFSGETGIPLGELGIIGDSNPTSHEALESSRDDIIAEAEQVMRTWTPDISAALRRGLAMLNRGDVPADLKPMPQWRPAQHISKAAAADAGSKIIDKAPWLAETEVGLELLGLSPEQIDRALVERPRVQGRQSLGEILERAGTSGMTADDVA